MRSTLSVTAKDTFSLFLSLLVDFALIGRMKAQLLIRHLKTAIL